jgi:uncharacterized membrane-anchored protein
MRRITAAAIIASILSITGAVAQTPRPEAGAAPTGAPAAAEANLSPQEKEWMNAQLAARQAAQHGPVDIKLSDQAVLTLPASYEFVPKLEAARLLRAMGNNAGPEFHGLIMSNDGENDWIITVDFHNSGYVRDEDAKTWNADELLTQLKDGTEAGNADRAERGFPALEVAGWAETPKYDQPTHRLVWSALAKEKSAPANSEMTVNYNTYALGRDGYYSLNLIVGQESLAANKQHASKILAALNFNDGKRYTDFVEGKDHVAEYGIAALVAGVAAKKLGLIALFGAFFIKGAKFILLALAGVFYGVKQLFSWRKKEPAPQTGATTSETPHGGPDSV